MPRAELDDQELARLMGAAQRGDAAAYTQLLDAITGRVRRIVAHRRGFVGHAEVEDIVQDVLLSLHAVRATYDPTRPFGPWLMAIVRHRLADAARRYARHGAREVSFDDPDVTFVEPSTKSGTESWGDSEVLESAIRQLPRGQREAIELVKLQELSLKEASKATGTSVGALKVATHRAVSALRRKLAGHHGDSN
jgi:RNA polymerase sigma-70 factor (ECF subfamily)